MGKAKTITLFVLLALLVITLVAVLAANIGWLGNAPQTVSFAKWGLGAVLAETIGLCIFVVKGLFKETKSSLLLCLPKPLQQIDPRSIEWDENECFIIGDRFTEKIRLVPARVGPSLRVHFPAKILDLIQDQEFLQIKLKDRKGRRWEVKPFYLFENLQELFPIQPIEPLQQDFRTGTYE